MSAARPGAWYRQIHWQIALAFAVAGVVSAVLHATGLTAPDSAPVRVADFVGELFLRLLKLAIVPLVFSTVTLGVAGIAVHRLGSLGLRTLAYFVGTTSIAVTIGLALVSWIEPGRGIAIPRCVDTSECPASYVCVDGGCVPTIQPPVLRDVFLQIVPINPFSSLAATFDLLGVIFFALLFGIAISAVGEEARPLERVLRAAGAVIQRIVDWIMAVAPIGIFALLVEMFAVTGWSTIGSLARYMLTVILGLAIHGLVVLPILLRVFGRVPAYPYFRAMLPALLTAYSTASSSATLPLSIRCASERGGVDRETASFVLPLGATVNMDGTALYEAVAALFIAQAFGVELGLGAQIVIFLTATLAAVGAPGIPSAGLVTMVVVLQAVGLPVEGIALLLAVDRLLDMFRTTINVWGDSVGAAILSSRAGTYTGVIAGAETRPLTTPD
jgi:proton glutamate symport protein